MTVKTKASGIESLYRKFYAVERAKAERDKVRSLNRPTMLENQRIRARNRNLKKTVSDYYYLLQKEDLLLMPKILSDDKKRLLDAEKRNRSNLYNRKPLEWVFRLNKIEDETLRDRVACIVWWDYFGRDEREGDYSELLDDYLTKPFVEVPLGKLIKGLMIVGYTAHHAILRTSKADDKN